MSKYNLVNSSCKCGGETFHERLIGDEVVYMCADCKAIYMELPFGGQDDYENNDQKSSLDVSTL